MTRGNVCFYLASVLFLAACSAGPRRAQMPAPEAAQMTPEMMEGAAEMMSRMFGDGSRDAPAAPVEDVAGPDAERLCFPLPEMRGKSGGGGPMGMDLSAFFGGGAKGAGSADDLRSFFSSYLQGPGVRVVPLTSKIAVHISAEAKQRECDYVLEATLEKRRGGKLKRALVKTVGAVAPLAGMVPGVGSLAGMAAAQAAGSVAMAGAFAGATQSDDIFELEYTLHATGGALVSAGTGLGKAKKDGEDVLSVVLEEAATEIVGSIQARTGSAPAAPTAPQRPETRPEDAATRAG